jgi:hypothetical protein
MIASVGCNLSMAKLRKEAGVAKAGVECWGSTLLADAERWNICRLMSFRRRQGRGTATISSDQHQHGDVHREHRVIGLLDRHCCEAVLQVAIPDRKL